MNTNDMKAQLATIKAQRASSKTAKGAAPVALDASDSTSFIEGTAHVIGAIPSAAIGFLDSIRVGYKYAEAKRVGKL